MVYVGEGILFWNWLLCSKCEERIHSSCAKGKRVTPNMEKDSFCTKCKNIIKNELEPIEKLCHKLQTVSEFCYFGTD